MAGVIGFDLDMTLVDSHRATLAAYRALAAQTGVAIDVEQIGRRLGPPLEVELARWFPAEQVRGAALRFVQISLSISLGLTSTLPGAYDALRAVHAAGGTTLLVTGKHHTLARRLAEHLGMDMDVVCGPCWGAAKANALVQHGAWVYLGDQASDMASAHEARVVAVGVTTGSASARELWTAGAEVVLRSLAEFPAWLSNVRDRGSNVLPSTSDRKRPNDPAN